MTDTKNPAATEHERAVEAWNIASLAHAVQQDGVTVYMLNRAQHAEALALMRARPSTADGELMRLVKKAQGVGDICTDDLACWAIDLVWDLSRCDLAKREPRPAAVQVPEDVLAIARKFESATGYMCEKPKNVMWDAERMANWVTKIAATAPEPTEKPAASPIDESLILPLGPIPATEEQIEQMKAKAEELGIIKKPAASPELLASAVKAVQFIENGVEFGYIRLPDGTDPAHQMLPTLRAAIAAEEARKPTAPASLIVDADFVDRVCDRVGTQDFGDARRTDVCLAVLAEIAKAEPAAPQTIDDFLRTMDDASDDWPLAKRYGEVCGRWRQLREYIGEKEREQTRLNLPASSIVYRHLGEMMDEWKQPREAEPAADVDELRENLNQAVRQHHEIRDELKARVASLRTERNEATATIDRIRDLLPLPNDGDVAEGVEALRKERDRLLDEQAARARSVDKGLAFMREFDAEHDEGAIDCARRVIKELRDERDEAVARAEKAEFSMQQFCGAHMGIRFTHCPACESGNQTDRAEKAEASADDKLREVREWLVEKDLRFTDSVRAVVVSKIDRLLAEPTQAEWDESIKGPEQMRAFLEKHPNAKVEPAAEAKGAPEPERDELPLRDELASLSDALRFEPEHMQDVGRMFGAVEHTMYAVAADLHRRALEGAAEIPELVALGEALAAEKGREPIDPDLFDAQWKALVKDRDKWRAERDKLRAELEEARAALQGAATAIKGVECPRVTRANTSSVLTEAAATATRLHELRAELDAELDVEKRSRLAMACNYSEAVKERDKAEASADEKLKQLRRFVLENPGAASTIVCEQIDRLLAEPAAEAKDATTKDLLTGSPISSSLATGPDLPGEAERAATERPDAEGADLDSDDGPLRSYRDAFQVPAPIPKDVTDLAMYWLVCRALEGGDR